MNREMDFNKMRELDRLSHAAKEAMTANSAEQGEDVVVANLKKELMDAVKNKDVLKRAEKVVELKKHGYSVVSKEDGVRITKDHSAPTEIRANDESEPVVSIEDLRKMYMQAYDQHRLDDISVLKSQIEASGYFVLVKNGKVDLVRKATSSEPSATDFGGTADITGTEGNEFDPSHFGTEKEGEKLELDLAGEETAEPESTTEKAIAENEAELRKKLIEKFVNQGIPRNKAEEIVNGMK